MGGLHIVCIVHTKPMSLCAASACLDTRQPLRNSLDVVLRLLSNNKPLFSLLGESAEVFCQRDANYDSPAHYISVCLWLERQSKTGM